MTITLDRSKPFSTVHGERIPGDPICKVHFFQSYKLGKKNIQLPFDSAGELVEDDGKTAPWTRERVIDGKPAMETLFPLYDDDMRTLVAKLKERAPEPDEDEGEEPIIAGSDNPADAGKTVDLRAWLRGQFKLSMPVVRAAMNAQFGRNPTNFKEAIEGLVEDEGVITLDEVHPDLRTKIGK